MLVLFVLGYIGLARRIGHGALMRATYGFQERLDAFEANLLQTQTRISSSIAAGTATGTAGAEVEVSQVRYDAHVAIAALKLLVRDSTRRTRLDSLEVAVTAWSATMAEVAALRKQRMELAQLSSPAAAMIDIGRQLDAIRREDGRLLMSQEEFDERGFRLVLAFLVAGTLVVGVTASLEMLVRSKHVTALQRLNARVTAAASEWTETFDAITLPIIIVNNDLTVRRLNLSSAQLVGLAPADAVGKHLRDLRPPALWKAVQNIVNRAPTSAAFIPAEVPVVEEGRLWQFDGHRAVLAADNRCVILVGRELTKLFALQEALRQREMMSAIGAVAAGVAHEVRNPLHAVEAIVGGLEAKFKNSSEVQAFIEHLRRQVEILGRLMSELLEYGKPAQAPQVPTQLGAVCVAAVRRCNAAALLVEVELRVDVQPNLPAVMLDAERMTRAIDNLLLNAVQHTPKGGRVAIIVDGVGAEASAAVRCTITDTGPGFREEDLPRVFEPFFTKRRGGTGLGLSIAERIVREHGGVLSAANAPKGGAVLSFTLPTHS